MRLSHGLFSNMGFPLRNVRPNVLTIFLALRLVLINFLLLQAYRDSVVGVGWMVRGPNSGTSMWFILYSESPDRLWGVPSLLFSGYRYHIPKAK